MKKMSLFPIVLLGFSCFVFASPISVMVTDTTPGISVHTKGLFAADLGIWNSPARFENVKQAIADGGFNFFRFPDGSLSNDYHWNGAGYYDSTHVWIPSDSSWAPGFLGETAYRGTSKNNWGFVRRSNFTDGDTNSFWWGNVYDEADPPWFVFDLGSAFNVDSLSIRWGSLSPKQFELAYWTNPYAPYPGAHQAIDNHFATLSVFPVKGPVSSHKFKSVQSRYFAVRFKAADLPKNGVQVKEVSLFQKSMDVTRQDSVKVFALSTRYGDHARTDWTGIPWQFETFMDYLKNFPEGEPVICVNAGTGTVGEAVAWVRYAKKKGYKIKNWQIGNELDGEWEETGPLSARQYAARFLEFARAMKAEDSTLLIHGPLYSTHKYKEKGAGLLDGKNWMPEFLRIVGEAEAKEGKRYLDAVDIHMYPYWAPNSLNALGMLNASMEVSSNLDSLQAWMSLYLNGDRYVHLSEFSTTTVPTSLTMESVQATAIMNVFAQFLVHFGDKGHALPWDVYGSLNKGPDDTYGSISLTTLKREGSWDMWGVMTPTAEYFGIYLAFNHWVREGFFVLPVKTSDTTLAAYALGKGDSSNILLLNLSGEGKEIQVSRASGAKGMVQATFFGEAQYHWQGTDTKAFANPGMGPSGTRLADGANATVKIPAFGLALVQFSPPQKKTENPRFLQASLAQELVLAGDTLDLTMTVYQKEGMLTYGKATVKNFGFSKKITPADGAWGSSLEALHIKIPVPENAQIGDATIYLEVLGLGNKVGTLRVPFRVRGKYRTISVFEDYEDSLKVNWYPVAFGDNSTSMKGKIFGTKGQGSFMQHDFFIEQPKTLGWPNFSAAQYPVKNELVKNSVGIVFDYATRHDNPEGYHELLVISNQVKDYDDFMYRLKNTQGRWVRDTVLWSSIRQEGWGIFIPRLEADQIHTFAFRGRHAGSGFIYLDNIYLLGETGSEVAMPPSLRRLR